MVQRLDNLFRLLGRGKIRKGQSSEHTIVKVVVERIRQRQVHVNHKLNELLLLDSKGNVFDYYGCRNQFVVVIVRIITALRSSSRATKCRVLLGLLMWTRLILEP